PACFQNLALISKKPEALKQFQLLKVPLRK
ncbi:MAG: hypothetical protein ACI9Y1_002085, partial [Lentisphaeria bacterium]